MLPPVPAPPPTPAFAGLIADLQRLAAPGLLADFTHFEVNEVVAYPKGSRTPTNVFTLVVGEEGPWAPAPATPLPQKSIQLPGLNGWSFRFVRYRLDLAALVQALVRLDAHGVWDPAGVQVNQGHHRPVTGRFAPPDGSRPLGINAALKNNFWAGSHLLELTDPDKAGVLKDLIDKPQRLQALTEALAPIVPLGLAQLSDRLGNILIQLPVTAVAAKLRSSPSHAIDCDLAWAPGVTPRRLSLVIGQAQDGLVVGGQILDLPPGRTSIPMPQSEGPVSAMAWDATNGVALWASSPSTFVGQINFTLYINESETRTFTESAGSSLPRRPQSIDLTSSGGVSRIGATGDNGLDAWTRRRLYDHQRAALRDRREFVQYLPAGASANSHMKALEDLRFLINQYGEGGAWLWDPFLDAEDILKTLIHCRHWDAPLRALSDAQTPPGATPSGTGWMQAQQTVLNANILNSAGLKLEFRARVGHPGWGFHDRFLIFPETSGGPLAWSLGTSINSFGHKHHILQKASDGRLIADAFETLWDALAGPRQQVWKTP